MHIFHTIYPEKANWRTILSQTNIYNIFPATVPLSNVRKILDGACIRKTSKYIPHASLWISRLFIELANRNDKVCLTLDCSNKNKDGPGRFRTDADNPDNQVCYFNSANDEQVYKEFVSERIKTPDSENDFHFKILEVKSKTNKNISFDATNELRELNKNDTKRIRGRVKTSFGREREIADYQDHLECLQSAPGYPTSTAHIPNPLQKTMDRLQKELNRDFFSSDNVVELIQKKKCLKMSTTVRPKLKRETF